MGLSIVAAIAEAHGGRARVTPSESGARLEIVVPVVVTGSGQELVLTPAATRTAVSSSPSANGLRR